MSSPVAVRIAGGELALRPRDYGHLQGLAARYAQARLAGHTIVNRATGRAIRLDWAQGLRGAVAPGTAPELLLALPALPALLAQARPLGAGEDPRRRHDVRRVHGFSATVEVAGRPIELWLLAREDKRGALAFDGVLPRSPLVAPREDGGQMQDLAGARSRALRAVLARAAPTRRQDGGGTPGYGDESGNADASPGLDDDTATAFEASSSEADAAGGRGRAPAPSVRVPLAFWETLPPGDARDAAQHGYSLEEWRALQRGETWTPPQQPEPGLWTRLGRGLAQDAEQSFGGSYGLPSEVYDALGGDNAPLTRWIYQPVAKTIDLLGNPNRGPAFVTNALTRVPAELAYSAGLVGSPERAKGEMDALALASGVVAGGHSPEVPLSLRASAAETPKFSNDLDPALETAEGAKAPLAPRGYSVAFVARLPPESYRGSYYSHRRQANQILLREMEADPELAKMMNDLGINPPRTSTGEASGKPIKGWTWHHEQNPGELHLVPREQHRWTSPHWRLLHPELPWGYRLWGKP